MVSFSVSTVAALSLLSGLAAAQPIDHHVHAREPEPLNVYVTAEETFYVTVGHEVAPSSIAQLPSTFSFQSVPVSVPTPTASVPTSAPIIPSVPGPQSVGPVPSKQTSASNPSQSSSPVGVGSGGAQGITYTPYTSNGGCKSAEEVASDVSKLSGFPIIRLYGTDCNQVANVAAAKAAGQKLFLGVYDVGNIPGSIGDIHDALNGDWSSVHTVSIGNELVNAGTASVGQVAGFVNTAREALTSKGYNGPVVAVDTFIATINNPGLCDISDYIAVNAHAFFDGNVASSDAGDWVLQQIQRVYTACGGKKSVTIVESGWPSSGETNNKAVASPQDQQQAIDSIKKTVGNDCYLFTAFNDFWKAPGAFSAEQFWGIFGNAAA